MSETKVSKVSKKVKLDVAVKGPEPYHAAVVDSVKKFLGTFQPEDWKKDVRGRKIVLDPDKNYRPGEVASILSVSYDTAVRRMSKMKGVVDQGTKERLHKRGKRLLTISGKHLSAYLRSKSL